MSEPNKSNFTALILVTGVDRPGITSAVINKLAEFSIDIIDIKQIVVGERLLQTILIKLLPDHALTLEADLTELSNSIGADIAIDFTQREKSEGSNQSAFFMLVENRLDPKRLTHLTNFIEQINGNITSMQIEKLSSLTSLTFQAEFANFDYQKIKELTKQLALSHGLDLYFDTELLNNGDRKLFVFDMDSTLIGQEVIDQIAELAGVSRQVEAITQQAMEGKLDFVESLNRRVMYLKDSPANILAKVSNLLTFNPGVLETISKIKKAGHKVAVVSGGFSNVIKID